MRPPNPLGLCMCGCGEPAPIAVRNFNRLGVTKGGYFRFIAGHGSRVYETREPMNPSGLCQCGCGLPTPIATYSNRHRGYIRGFAVNFIRGHFRRNAASRKLKTDVSKTSEYRAYWDAKDRCTNSNHQSWKDYGGRGIKFLFVSFEQFLKVLGPRTSVKHSLDRFPNNNGHYEPGNVRWATKKEQIDGRRALPGLRPDIKVSEVTALYEAGLTCEQIANKLNTTPDTIHKRLKKGQVKTRPTGRRGIALAAVQHKLTESARKFKAAV
jgi:hypothetical protein